eukprot:scaffold18596_cov63-Phaeocystis_antarctica.AAC.1
MKKGMCVDAISASMSSARLPKAVMPTACGSGVERVTTTRQRPEQCAAASSGSSASSHAYTSRPHTPHSPSGLEKHPASSASR